MTTLNAELFKALVAFLPASLLLVGSTILFLRRKTLYTSMQLFGTGCIVAVVFCHVCEALHWLPFMRWGSEQSVGHYVDLACAALGLTLFPAGYLPYTLFSEADVVARQ